MAKIEDITVEVKCNLTVDDKTAMRCLRILEIWQDSNRDKMIICERKADGSTSFSIKKDGD
jgi:hypothetical protein